MNSDALPDIRLKCPDLASIIPGRRFLYRAKVGGERQTVTVTASCAPYPRDFGKGRRLCTSPCTDTRGNGRFPQAS